LALSAHGIIHTRSGDEKTAVGNGTILPSLALDHLGIRDLIPAQAILLCRLSTANRPRLFSPACGEKATDRKAGFHFGDSNRVSLRAKPCLHGSPVLRFARMKVSGFTFMRNVQ